MINRKYRHKKSGGIYRLVARGFLEMDLTPVTVYVSAHDGTVWVRPTAEFDDGRFEPVDEASDG